MAMITKPWMITTTADGTCAVISMLMPPERRKPKNKAPRTTPMLAH